MPCKVVALKESSLSLKEEELDPRSRILTEIAKKSLPYRLYDIQPRTLFSFLSKKKALSEPQTDAPTLKKNILSFFESVSKEEGLSSSRMRKLFDEEILKSTTIPSRIASTLALYSGEAKYVFLQQFRDVATLTEFWKRYGGLSSKEQEILHTVAGGKETLDILESYQDETKCNEEISEWIRAWKLIEEIEGNESHVEKLEFGEMPDKDIRESFRGFWSKKNYGSEEEFFILNKIPLKLPRLNKVLDKEKEDAFMDWLVCALEHSHDKSKIRALSGLWLQDQEKEEMESKSTIPTQAVLKSFSFLAFKPADDLLRELFSPFFILHSGTPLWRQNKDRDERTRFVIVIREDHSFTVTQVKTYKLTTEEEKVLGGMEVHWKIAGDSKGNYSQGTLSLRELRFTLEADLKTRLNVLSNMKPSSG